MHFRSSITGRRVVARALASCAVLPALLVAQAPRGIIAGRITSADGGQPLQGASVVVVEATIGALARADGTFRLQLAPGTYRLNARLIGYVTENRTVTVAAGQTVRLELALRRAPQTLQQVAVVGAAQRNQERVVTTAPVPVDVITAEEIKQTGRTETAQILQMLVPSLNFPRSSIAGGVDGQRPFTLRGMNPDQVLVLVNGKRRHIGAVVAVNNSVGRGSSGVDLNAIPASSIERIEVLRDGAAAQYGSDAIAGVVNIVLKKNAPAQFSSTVGRVASTLDGALSPVQGSVRYSDGGVLQTDMNYSWSIGDNGYINLGAEYRDRGRTNRAAPDLRQQFFNDATVAPERLALARNNAWYGDAALKEGGAMLNAGGQFRNGTEWYAFGGAFRRQSQAFGFPRRPLERVVVRSIHPNGFLPEIWGTSTDASGTVGLKGRWGKVGYDFSGQYGGNRFRFDVRNTNNPTLGASSPTEFYAGQLEATIAQLNADFTRSFEIGWAGPLNLAFGAEGRREGYRIIAGEPGSFIDGGVRVLDGPEQGQPTVSGSQLFYGFRPVDARRPRRGSTALYVDLEAQPVRRLTLGLAGRREEYSDFGEATIGKVTSRFDMGAGWAVRAAYSTGFRAPTLGQANYRATASNVLIINGVPTPNEALTLAVNEPAALALGASPLRPEKSRNLSAGLTYNPSRTFTATVDFFRIDVDDRIVLSENFVGAGVRQILANNGITGLDIRPRFFTNAVDTRTQGVDVVVRYLAELGDKRTLNATLGYNHNDVALRRVSLAPAALQQAGQTQLFGRVERSRLVEAQPRHSFRGNLVYSHDKWNVNLQQAWFGSVVSRSNLTAVAPAGTANPTDLLSWRDPGDQTFAGRWLTDVSFGYQLDPKFLVSLGADNIFDVYPDRITVNNPDNFGGTRLFNPFSPFGANGRFVWARVTYTP